MRMVTMSKATAAVEAEAPVDPLLTALPTLLGAGGKFSREAGVRLAKLANNYLQDEPKRTAIDTFIDILGNDVLRTFTERIERVTRRFNDEGRKTLLGQAMEDGYKSAELEGPVTAKSFGEHLLQIIKIREKSSKNYLEEVGMPVNETNLLLAEMDLSRNDAWRHFTVVAAHNAVESRMSADKMMELAVLASLFMKRRTASKDRASQERLMESKEIDDKNAAAAKASTFSPEHMASQLGLAPELAQELLVGLPQNADFIALVSRCGNISPATSVVIGLAYQVAEKYGMQPDLALAEDNMHRVEPLKGTDQKKPKKKERGLRTDPERVDNTTFAA
jgi:hypothetical protein